MARPGRQWESSAAAAVFTLYLISIFTVVVPSSEDPDAYIVPSPLLGTNNRHAMFFPLVLSQLNSSRSSVSTIGISSRRHLQRSDSQRPNARMALHDDLLLNGYYTTRLYIGSPPQKFALIVDTGSTVTYVPCSTCEQCGKHQDPKFQPDQSSTYKPVKCKPDCTCDNDRVQCVYDRQYAEMSSSSGVLGDDIISFGNQSELKPQRAVFGCENVETGDLYSQHADGIMGLGRGELSIVDQLVDRGVISDSFSLCYGGMDVGGGAMVLGGISPPSDMVFTNSDPGRSPYYNIELKEIHVAGKALALSPHVFDGKHGTVLDSGTTYAYLPEAAFVAFKTAITKELQSLKQIRGPDPNYHDICFSGAGSHVSEISKTFPTVDMVFSTGHKLSLSPENYLFRHSKVQGAYCLGVFQNGKDPTTLLGGIIVRNTFVMYDRENEKIGFWKTNCTDLWERLNATGAPPPSSPSNKTNTTAEPPVPSHTEPPKSPAGILIAGFVTFYMSLNVSYSDLQPSLPDLEKDMAKELDVKPKQVHILDVKAKGNDSIIKWAVYNEGSTDHISNTTATNIFRRLSGNHIHLPHTYGNYKFSQWKIEHHTQEHHTQRTWWQTHRKIVLGTIFGILVIAIAATVVWFVWKRGEQQSQLTYKPVDTAAPEQEMQPL